MTATRRVLTCVTFLLCGCNHTSDSTNDPPGGRDDTPFAEGDWHTGVPLRRVGDAYRDEIARVVVTPSGNVAAIRRAQQSRRDFYVSSALETFDPQGHRLASAGSPPMTFLADVVVHPSGEFTVVEVRRDGPVLQSVWLRRLGADLHLIRETALRDEPPMHERLVYEFELQPDGTSVLGKVQPLPVPGDGIVHVDFVPGPLRHLVLAARGEEAILSTLGFGTKVYALTPDLHVIWSRQVLPIVRSWTVSLGQESLTVDGAGGIGIAFPVDGEVFQAYEQHFGRDDRAWSGPSYQTMVTRLSADGRSATMQLFHHGETRAAPMVSGIAMRDDRVALCGSVRVDRFQATNQSMEWDLSWVRGTLSSGTAESGAIDVKRNDYTLDCKFDANDGVLFSGVNDFVQQDTGMWVELGQGFLYGIDAMGRETARLSLRGPRHTEIRSFDHEFFGGTFDGPLPASGVEYAEKAMLGTWR
ncbi:hypothetical protein LVJ94_50140 [Pendulispora rubella]|uniref:Lipoprotein n=1 Tax=Pendulispora rubella TaxID=2741070 RepID=A0ABZ2L2H1_9BACT